MFLVCICKLKIAIFRACHPPLGRLSAPGEEWVKGGVCEREEIKRDGGERER